MERQSLDLTCAQYGTSVAREAKDEPLVRKSLGILQEDGLYAFFLYLAAEKKDGVKKAALEFLKDQSILGEIIGEEEKDALVAIPKKFADRLDDLSLAKELMERVLVYALYHIKATAKVKGAEEERS